MTSIVKICLVLVCCILAFNGCVSNPLPDRNQPNAQGSGELEHHQIQRQENEDAPPPLNNNAPNNTIVQQGLGSPSFRNGEIFLNRSSSIQERSEGNLQRNKTSEHSELSSEQNPDQAAQASSLERNATADSSRNDHIVDHLNVISIHRNNSESDLQADRFSHDGQASHRDQSSNVNFGPSGNQEEHLSVVKRTVLPALFPETQNGSLPTHSSISSESGEIPQSEIIHENDTNLQGNREHETRVMENETTITVNTLTTTLSPETLNSNLLLPDTHPDSVNIIEPGVDTEGNVTENRQANETSIANKQDGTSLPTESVPLVTIRFPTPENQATEIPQPNNRGEENSNAINSTTREPLPTKENKYRTKDGIPEMTLPIKDPDQPEIATEHNTFPQISSTEPVTFLPSSTSEGFITEKQTTRSLPEEVASTTVSSMKPTTQFTTRLPTEQIIIERTTFSTHPQEQLPTEKIFSVNSFSSSGISYTSTTPSNEEARETPTQFPPSERVPEVPIRYPTEQINPEPTEPIILTSTRAVVVTEAGSGGGQRTTFPDENVPHVTLRIPTEPMEIPSTTVLPETTSINLNGKRSSAPYAEVTEKMAGKTDKGSHVLATESTTIGINSTTLIPSTVTTKERPGPVQITTTTTTTTTTATTTSTSTTTTSAEMVQRSSYSTIQSTFPQIEIHNTTEPSIQLTTRPPKTKHPLVSSSLPSNNMTTTTFSRPNTPPTRATGINTRYNPTLTFNTTSQLLTHPSTQQHPSTSKPIERTNVTFEQTYPASKDNSTVTSISTTTSNYPTTPLNTSNKHNYTTTRTPQNTSTAASRLTPSLVGTTTSSSIIPSLSVHNATSRWPNSTSRSTTKKQRTNAPTTKKPTEIPHKPTEKPEDVATTPAIVPPAYISMQFQMTLNEYCSGKSTLTKVLTDIVKRKTDKTFNETQIKFINQLCYDERVFDPKYINDTKSTIVTVDIYMTDKKGQIDIQLTVDSSHVLRRGFLTSQSRYGQKLVNVHLITSYVNNNQKDYQETGLSSGMTIAVIIVIIGGVCCICLIVIQILMHKRHEKGSRNILPGPNRFSLRSLDSIALNAVPKSRPHSGFWNPGLDRSEENISSSPTNPLGFNSLSNMTRDMVEIYKEYEKLPHETPNLSCVPIGAEDKNRFANVIPISHSRVKLKKLPHEEHSDYINANFITGYNGDVHAYIATQAPLSNTIGDFWRMVWEQQSRVIIMLMAVNEASQPRDPSYVPDTEGVNGRVRYGDIVLVLKKTEVRQEYIMSLLEVKDIEHNLVREVRNFWFTSWSVDSIPEPISVIKLILDTRVHYEDSGAPVIVHCSSGTGRTGTLIAIDICMRSYESKRVVDILSCVSSMRKERAGVVQNKEQYALIYKTLNEYAVIMGSPRLAPSSSSAIQLQHML